MMHEALQLRLNLVRTMEWLSHTSLSLYENNTGFQPLLGTKSAWQSEAFLFRSLYPLPSLLNLLFPSPLSFLSGLSSRQACCEHQFPFLPWLLPSDRSSASVHAKRRSKKPVFYLKTIKFINSKLLIRID